MEADYTKKLEGELSVCGHWGHPPVTKATMPATTTSLTNQVLMILEKSVCDAFMSETEDERLKLGVI